MIVLRSLCLLAEAKPPLSELQFSDLHHSLTNSEGCIALAHAYFNDMATHLNTQLEQFPHRLVTLLTHIPPPAVLHNVSFIRNASSPSL